VAVLRGRRLDAEDFDQLIIGDPIRDLLTWMSDSEAFEAKSDPERRTTFRNVCIREFGFDPDADGVRTAAESLITGNGRWNEVWQRFCEAPTVYPGVSQALRDARPKDLLGLIDKSRQPGL